MRLVKRQGHAMPPPSPVFTAPRVGAPQVLWAAGAQLGEGLCWSAAEQALYWVDILGQSIMRQAMGSGERRVWPMPQTVSAVAERAGGGLIVSLRREIAFFDPRTGALERLPEAEPQWPGNRFNDGKCDAQGRFWACTMDFACTAHTGSLYRVVASPQGPVVECAWAANFPVVNGPAWSLDGRTLWLNDTARNAVHALDFDAATGTVSRPREWLRFAPGDGLPDGMTTDAQGRLWIAHWGGGCVTCHAPDDGRELARVALPTSNVTNVAFGGPDFSTLFISTAATELDEAQRAREPLAGALFAAETDATGLPAHRFAG
jgi:sugar lactone lactonase YvrE